MHSFADAVRHLHHILCNLRQLTSKRPHWILRGSSSEDDMAFLSSRTTSSSPSRSLIPPHDLLKITKELPHGFRTLAIEELLSKRTVDIIIQATKLKAPTQTCPEHITAETSSSTQPRTFMTFHESLHTTDQPLNLNNLTLLAIFLFTCRNSSTTTTQSRVPILLKETFEYFRQQLSTALFRLDIQTIIENASTDIEIQGEIRHCLAWIFIVAADSWTMAAAGVDAEEGSSSSSSVRATRATATIELMNSLERLMLREEEGKKKQKMDLAELLKRYLYSNSMILSVGGLLEIF